MKSRGKKKDTPQEARSMHEVFYEAASAHLLMMQRAEKRAREKLGIEPPKPKRKLIERTSDGIFLYKNKPITKDMETQYMRVFRAVFESANNEDYIPYSPLNRRIELYGEEQLLDQKRVAKRIQNGVKEFFYKTKVPEFLPDGRKLIDYKRGKGVIFINPDLG